MLSLAVCVATLFIRWLLARQTHAHGILFVTALRYCTLLSFANTAVPGSLPCLGFNGSFIGLLLHLSLAYPMAHTHCGPGLYSFRAGAVLFACRSQQPEEAVWGSAGTSISMPCTLANMFKAAKLPTAPDPLTAPVYQLQPALLGAQRPRAAQYAKTLHSCVITERCRLPLTSPFICQPCCIPCTAL